MASAVDRVLEVAVGGVTGFIVSLVLLPSSAHRLVAERAARTLDQMAGAIGELLVSLTRGMDVDALHHIQHGIGQALAQFKRWARRQNASFRRISLPAPTPHRSCALCSGCATILS